MSLISDAWKKQQALLNPPEDALPLAGATATTGIDKAAGPVSDGGGSQAVWTPGGAGTVVPAPGAAPAAVPPPPPFVPPPWAPEAERAATPVLGPMTVPEAQPGPLSTDPAAGTGGVTPTGAPAAPAPGAPPVAPAAAVPPTPNPLNTALKDALLKMLGQGDPTLNDPGLKAQSDAFHLAQTRAKQRDRETMAARAAATGQISDLAGSGAFDEGLGNLEQRQGEAEAGFDAGLVGDERAKRHQELLQAAALAGGQLSQEEQLAFQKELAKTSEGQFQQTFDQSAKQWADQFGMEGQKLAEATRQFDTTTQAGRDALKQQLEMFKASQGEAGRQFDVDAELKKLGINQQGALGQGDLDLRRFLGEGNLNLGLLSALFQNNQFGQGLSSNNAQFSASQNNGFLQALLAALGQAA